MKHILSKMALAGLAAAAALPANALVIGTADSSNSIPFGGNGGGYYFQQVYSAASFASGLDISSLTFYNSFSPGGTPAIGSFQIYLSTTTEAIGTFDTSFLNYSIGSFQQVYDGVLPALSSGKLNFNLSSAFHYDSAAGNLMLTVRTFDLGAGSLFLDADQNVGLTNSRFSAYPYDWNQGLVTGFNEVAQVPLPAGLPLLLSGMGALGAMLRRRRAA
jgi:hypothetical protein